jgi:hypothetical protein
MLINLLCVSLRYRVIITPKDELDVRRHPLDNVRIGRIPRVVISPERVVAGIQAK